MAVGVAIFLCAYSIGKQNGRQAGIQQGKSSMLLELREQSLMEGCCILCRARKLMPSNETKCRDTKKFI
jgi:hypothetical protein